MPRLSEAFTMPEYRTAECATIANLYAGKQCTLDGAPASILGRMNRFATIASLNSALRAEYAWETVARVMAKDGAFRS